MKSSRRDREGPPSSSPTEARASDRRDYPVQVCEVCHTEMFGLHCKIVCPNCGYKRDCSDP